MAAIAPGSEAWWKWAAEGGLDVKTTTTEPTSDRDSRREAKKSGLRKEPDEVLRVTKVGWNMTKGLGGHGHKCYWHTNDPTRYTTTIKDLRIKLNLDAPKKKSKKRGFSCYSDKKKNAKSKAEGSGVFRDSYHQDPDRVAAQKRDDNVRKCRDAAAGLRIGTSSSAKSKAFNNCAFLGELYVLMYIGLFNPQMRPLICVCELWWILERYDIECEFERWYGWMEDMWYCNKGSAAGSGGIVGRLVKLDLGTTTEFTNSWPEVERPADMGRVAALLGVTEEYLRDNSVGPFHKTFLAREPGNLVYQIHHASRPAWHSRTSCWHRLVATLYNLRRPHEQIFPGQPFGGRAVKLAPNGMEWFAGAGQWCLQPVMKRAALLKIDGSALAPADFTGPQRTIVIMSLASLYEGRQMFVRHGAESRAPSVWSGSDDRRRTRAVATVPALTTSSTQVEVKWHRPDLSGERATIVLAHALVRLANEHPRYKYAVPEGNALKVAASLVNSCKSGRARGMWVVVSDYLRERGWLDALVTERRTLSAGPFSTWGWRRADGGVEQLTWRPAPAGHGRAHGVSDAAAERAVHAAAAYEDFVGNRAAFIEAARDIQNTHFALSDAECAAPMKCFPDAHADVLKMREPPHVTDPNYKKEVGTGLLVFTLSGLYGRADDADVLREAEQDYLGVRGDLIKRCWRHHAGNLHRVSEEYAATVATAVELGHRPDDEEFLGALVRVVEDVEDAANAAALEDAVEGAEEEGAEEEGADDEVVVDYLDDAASPTDLEEGARVDCWYANDEADEDDEERGWYPATVARVCGSDVYAIDFDDGHDEPEVPARELRPRAAPDTKSFHVGNLVMVNWRGLGDFCEARLRKRDRDGFDVIFTVTGDEEKCVPVSRMRPVREADRAAMRRKSYNEYANGETKLTEWDLEVAASNDLRAACRCRGNVEKSSSEINSGSVDDIRKWLRQYLERHEW